MIRLTRELMMEHCNITYIKTTLQKTLRRVLEDFCLFGYREKLLTNSLTLLKLLYESVRALCVSNSDLSGRVYSHGSVEKAEAIRILHCYGLCDDFKEFDHETNKSATLKSWDAELPRLTLDFDKLTKTIVSYEDLGPLLPYSTRACSTKLSGEAAVMERLTREQMLDGYDSTVFRTTLQRTLKAVLEDIGLFGPKEKPFRNSPTLLKLIYEAVRAICVDNSGPVDQVYSQGSGAHAAGIRMLNRYGLCNNYQGIDFGNHNAAQLKDWNVEFPRVQAEFEQVTKRCLVEPRGS